MNDFENLTIGMIIGYITTYNNEHLEDEDKEDQVVMASQAHFDSY